MVGVDSSGASASSAFAWGNRYVYCCGGVTCPGCPIETPNVVGVDVRVSVESSSGSAAALC